MQTTPLLNADRYYALTEFIALSTFAEKAQLIRLLQKQEGLAQYAANRCVNNYTRSLGSGLHVISNGANPLYSLHYSAAPNDKNCRKIKSMWYLLTQDTDFNTVRDAGYPFSFVVEENSLVGVCDNEEMIPAFKSATKNKKKKYTIIMTDEAMAVRLRPVLAASNVTGVLYTRESDFVRPIIKYTKGA